MRKLILYIATSLDGYIARPDGSVDWLFIGEETDYGYGKFYAGIDTTLMGRKTYEQVLTFGEFPYRDKINYVFSHQEPPSDAAHVTFVARDAVGFIRNLKQMPGADIWLIGGGGLIQTCLQDDLLDEMWVFIHPILLGEGLPLVPPPMDSVPLKLLKQQVYDDGIVALQYELKPGSN